MLCARRLRVSLLLIACVASVLSCATPQSHEEATDQLISKGTLRNFPESIMQTSVIDAAGSCDGAMGSVLPPLSRVAPFAALQAVFETVPDYLPGPDSPDPDKREVSLAGIERSWVRQNDPSGCWAATLETARDYLHLHHVSQKEIQALVSKECKQLQTQKGAEAFQVGFAMIKLSELYDHRRQGPGFCLASECIVERLNNKRPVILLSANHAVLIKSITYRAGSAGGKEVVIPLSFEVLDPAGNGTPEKKPIWELFKADAILSF